MQNTEYGAWITEYIFFSSCSALQLLPLAFFAHHYLLSPLCVPIPSETFEPGSETTKLRVTVLVSLASLDSFDSFDSIGTDVNDLGTTPHMYGVLCTPDGVLRTQHYGVLRSTQTRHLCVSTGLCTTFGSDMEHKWFIL